MSQRVRQLLWLTPGAGLLLLGLFADLSTSSATRAWLCRVIVCVAALVVLLCGYWWSQPGRRWNRKHAYFALIACLLVFGLAELICSVGAWAVNTFATPPLKSFWIFEESERTVHFDPIRGYRLTQTPSRYARVTHGELEFVGTLRGNVQGYPDEDDFTIEKPATVDKRILVFGDSFSAAQYVGQNWPDFVEEEVHDRWQLYNFSTDGGGLANWWSNYTGVVEAEGYQFDTVIFAVYQGDLNRKFTFAEHRGYQRHMFTRTDSWDPESWPKSDEAAKRSLGPYGGSYILRADEFAKVIECKRLSRSEYRPTFFQRFWLTCNTYNACQTIGEAFFSPPVARPPQTEPQQTLMEDFRQRLARRQVEVIVVHIPGRDELLGYDAQTTLDGRAEAMRFAELLGATFVDGAKAFRGLNPQQIRAHWLPYDGHWAQAGSDRFGKFMVEVLKGE